MEKATRTGAATAMLAAIVGSCTPDLSLQREYERVSAELSPVIVALKPKVRRILGGTSSQEIAAACVEAEDQLWMLRSIRPDDEVLYDAIGAGLQFRAAMLLDYRREFCDEPNGCADWCGEGWAGLVRELMRLRASAYLRGVAMETLP